MGRCIHPYLWPILHGNTINTTRSFTHNNKIYHRSPERIFPGTLYAKKYEIGKEMFYQIWHINN